MKKVASFLVVVSLLTFGASAFAETDLSAMSTDDLMSMRNDIDAEIQRRTSSDAGTVIYDSDGIKVYFVGIDEGYQTNASFSIENDSMKNVEAIIYIKSVNEWTYNPEMWRAELDAESGMKAMDSIYMYEVEKLGIEEYEKMSVTMTMTDTDTGEIIADHSVLSFTIL